MLFSRVEQVMARGQASHSPVGQIAIEKIRVSTRFGPIKARRVNNGFFIFNFETLICVMEAITIKTLILSGARAISGYCLKLLNRNLKLRC